MRHIHCRCAKYFQVTAEAEKIVDMVLWGGTRAFAGVCGVFTKFQNLWFRRPWRVDLRSPLI
jgi:hypothetical protein